ncbi:MAG: hypothetical protein ACTIJA_02660 [Bavariicoccus seileri]|uniref:hypothetical protein n=1 Tax=Bavariicoccus seileri TaxID=549685 RepID=UPI001F0A6588|nr:hypothetical protein [Bavariicoccus seileri]
MSPWSYGYLNSNIEIDESLLILKEAMDPMLKLAEIEKNVNCLVRRLNEREGVSTHSNIMRYLN